MNSRRSPSPLPAVLPHDKSRGSVKGPEILDVEIVHPYFYRKSLFEERRVGSLETDGMRAHEVRSSTKRARWASCSMPFAPGST